VIQNASSMNYVWTFGHPFVTWDHGVTAPVTVTVPTTYRMTTGFSGTFNDSDDASKPLYDQGPGSVARPIGCSGGGPAMINDTPSISGGFHLPALTASGATVGTVWYTMVNARIDANFTTWAVIYNNDVSHEYCLLRERPWTLHLNSAASAPQRATVGTAQAPNDSPVATSTFANTLLRTNLTVTPSGLTSIPKPH
jgi:hypothetical protein